MNIIKSVAANEIIINDEVKQNIPNISAGDAQIIQLFNTAYLWAGIICVAIIIVSGILYTTSAGNSDRIKTAKKGLSDTFWTAIFLLLWRNGFYLVCVFCVEQVKNN